MYYTPSLFCNYKILNFHNAKILSNIIIFFSSKIFLPNFFFIKLFNYFLFISTFVLLFPRGFIQTRLTSPRSFGNQTSTSSRTFDQFHFYSFSTLHFFFPLWLHLFRKSVENKSWKHQTFLFFSFGHFERVYSPNIPVKDFNLI